MSSLARWCYQHRLVALLSWVVLLVALAGALVTAGTSFSSSPTSQNSESATASALLQHASAAGGGNSGYVVWQTSDGTVKAASVEAEMSGVLATIAHDPGVASVTSPYSSAGASQVSSDHTVAYANVQFDRTATKAQQSAVQSQALARDTAGVHVAVGGQAFESQTAAGGPADVIGIVLAFLILLLVFRAAWVAALIGLGVGIDYALFIVNRHRGNLMAGMSVGDSIAAALNTSGRAMVFAGLTVIAALLGMTTLGLRVLSRAQRRRLADPSSGGTVRAGFWPRWAAVVAARPRLLAAVGLVVLVALAAPALSLRLGSADDGNLAAGSTNRQAYDLLSDGFGPGFNGPLQIAVQTHGQCSSGSSPCWASCCW